MIQVRRSLGLLSVLALGFFSGACDAPPNADDEAGGPVVSTDTVAGVPVVTSSGEAPLLRMEPVLSLGSLGGAAEPAPDEFGSVTSVAVGPEGHLWVADGRNARIQVFDRDGVLVRSVGREGQGPGEFGAVNSLAWLGDTLLVLDFGNGRIAELSRDGEWLGVRPAPGRISGSPAMLRLYAVGPTEVYQWSLQTEPAFRRVWVAHTPAGPGEVVPQLETDGGGGPPVTCEGGGGISFFGNPWTPALHQHPAPGGRIWAGFSDAYRIALVAGQGDTVRIVRREVEPPPLSEAAWSETRREYEAWREEWEGADCSGTLQRPERQPAFRNLLVDVAGRLWVERNLPEGTLWEIFDAEGRLVATVPAFRYSDRAAPYLSPGHLAWVAEDVETGIPRVHLAALLPVER